MNKELLKIESTYWKISKMVAVLFILINYKVWTMPYSFIKAIAILIGIAIGTFVSINLLDLFVGIVVSIFKYIHKRIKERRLLKGFCKSNTPRINKYNGVE